MGTHPGSSYRVGPVLAAAALLLAVVLIAPAAAAAPERLEYVNSLESICKPGVESTQRAVRGVRSDIRAERLQVAAAKLARAGRIFDGTVSKISRVPRPDSDTEQLAKWFHYLRLQEDYLASSAAALRAERIARYQHSSVRFVHTGNLANDVVIFFGFDYCRFKFSRFG
jgi:hypothetical protein